MLNNRLVLKNGLFCFAWLNNSQRKLCLLVPKAMQQEILHCCHGMSHLRTIPKINIAASQVTFNEVPKVPWLAELFQSFFVCYKNKKSSKKPKAPRHCHHAEFPLEHMLIDILGPFTPSKHGKFYVLVMKDQFTKWIECGSLPNQIELSVAKKFLLHFIVTFGCPLAVYTNHGLMRTCSRPCAKSFRYLSWE